MLGEAEFETEIFTFLYMTWIQLNDEDLGFVGRCKWRLTYRFARNVHVLQIDESSSPQKFKLNSTVAWKLVLATNKQVNHLHKIQCGKLPSLFGKW